MHANANTIAITHASPAPEQPLAWHDDAGLSHFMAVRPRLFSVAYRIVGDAAGAEDIVQDVWLRWQTTDRRAVRSPAAFLVTATSRLAINVVRSARHRHETPASASHPEPADTGADPVAQREQDEALNAAVLILVETLSPVERTAYVLREAFSCSYREIARVLQVQEANARQLVTRARIRVSGGRRAAAGLTEHRRWRDAFVMASRSGDVTHLERTFAANLPRPT